MRNVFTQPFFVTKNNFRREVQEKIIACSGDTNFTLSPRARFVSFNTDRAFNLIDLREKTIGLTDMVRTLRGKNALHYVKRNCNDINIGSIVITDKQSTVIAKGAEYRLQNFEDQIDGLATKEAGGKTLTSADSLSDSQIDLVEIKSPNSSLAFSERKKIHSLVSKQNTTSEEQNLKGRFSIKTVSRKNTEGSTHPKHLSKLNSALINKEFSFLNKYNNGEEHNDEIYDKFHSTANSLNTPNIKHGRKELTMQYKGKNIVQDLKFKDRVAEYDNILNKYDDKEKFILKSKAMDLWFDDMKESYSKPENKEKALVLLDRLKSDEPIKSIFPKSSRACKVAQDEEEFYRKRSIKVIKDLISSDNSVVSR